MKNQSNPWNEPIVRNLKTYLIIHPVCIAWRSKIPERPDPNPWRPFDLSSFSLEKPGISMIDQPWKTMIHHPWKPLRSSSWKSIPIVMKGCITALWSLNEKKALIKFLAAVGPQNGLLQFGNNWLSAKWNGKVLWFPAVANTDENGGLG